MRLENLGIGLVCGLCFGSLTTTACGDDSGSDGTTTGSSATDDGGETAADTTAGGDTGAATGGSGSDDDTAGSDDGPIDPTDGVEPPVVECGDGVLPTGIAIESDEDIAMLNGISVVTGDFIVDSTNYANLDFMSCLTEIQGNIQIFNNPFLLDMSGTDNLVALGRLPAATPTPQDPDAWDQGKGSISISNNPLLINVNGFNGLTDIGGQGGDGDCPGAPFDVECDSFQSLVIRDNDGAAAVTGFSSLEFIFGSLTISQNDAITNIDSLTSLVGIGGFFAVNNNPSLCITSVNAVGKGLKFLGDEGSSTTVGNDGGC